MGQVYGLALLKTGGPVADKKKKLNSPPPPKAEGSECPTSQTIDQIFEYFSERRSVGQSKAQKNHATEKKDS
ncbi:hypothetical protein CL689_02420 [Candidatus Saccharibacteria bacterium]|nr:hypothetical protein [Candidatus Saccharibacteria bacterium]